MEAKDFTVLYVDDEIHNLISFNATFRKDYRILTAKDGPEALELLRSNEVHVVLSDQRMPGITGVQLLEKVKSEFPGTIRMIITGYSDIDAVIDAINKGGVFRYITKPWDEREMRMTINNARQLFGLQEENIVSQFETLKSQVNPHFLFNSLNVLTSLIYIDQDKAAKFVVQLSRVYRYALENRERDLVELQEEMPFVESYIFLLKTRFENNLIVEMEIGKGEGHKKIAPMVIQMLLENAIKHNVISRSKPLTIRLETADGAISVANNLQLKSSTEVSSRIGLENIRKRYEYLTRKKISVSDDNGFFRVEIPLLD